MPISKIYNRHSIGCPCQDGISYPEKFIFKFLEQIFKNNFIYQLAKRHYEWIGKYRYDFYFILNNIHYIIETDGGFHYKESGFKGLTKKERKEIDRIKNIIAEEHNITMIRIDCKESDLNYIKEKILESELKHLFDLSKIDWEKCHEFALSNLVKKACMYKKNNSEWTTTKIAEIMKLTPGTINRYLKQGTKLNWCEYKPEEEIKKNRQNLKNINCKSVEIFKDGVSLGKFKSVSELARQSENIFNIKLSCSCICGVCNGKLKKHKGFQFKFIK